MWKSIERSEIRDFTAAEMRASGGNDRSLSLVSAVLNYRPYLDKYERSSADARLKGFNARIPLPGQRIKARCTDDHQLTFALSSHFPFLAASSPALAVVTWRSECRRETCQVQ